MEKLLCPYCDHEIKKAGRCATCGSKVRKPIKVQTSAVFDSQPSAQPGECGCDVHSPKQTGSSTSNANWQDQVNQQKQVNRQNQRTPQKPIKNSYSPFLEHIKNLPTVTKIVLIYVIINLVIAFINFVLMGY